METTGGLVSAYQLLDYSAQTVAAHCVSVTNAEVPSFELVSLQDLLNILREKEFLKVKRSPLLIDPELKKEFQVLDTLSDEALIGFEQKLA
jgi:hypothetical protein